jgi:hypothetical protein
MKYRNDLSANFVRSLLDYDANTGVLTWKAPRNKVGKAGDVAGSWSDGYLKIAIRRQRYTAHRLAWLITHGEWPEGYIDHKDGNRSNNAIDNLRLATCSENLRNRPRERLYGTFEPRTGRYVARIRHNGKLLFLGRYRTHEEAHQAYLEGSLKYHGEFGAAHRSAA